MAHRSACRKTLKKGLILIFLCCWTTAPAAPVLKTEHAEVRLLSEQQQIRPGHSFWLALQLRPKPGWHTYWKNPGDAGKATAIQWSLPPGWQAGPLHWPYPKRIRSGSLVSFGYTDSVSLLTEISANTVPSGTRKIEISAMADWLVCEEICIPENAALSLSLPLGHEAVPNPETASEFKDTRALLPKNVSWTARYKYKDNRLIFDAPLSLSDRNGGNADSTGSNHRPASGLETLLFFPVEDNLIENASGQSFLLGENGVRVSVNMGYLQQTGPFRGILVLKKPSGTVEAMEFTADPVKRLPAFIEQ